MNNLELLNHLKTKAVTETVVTLGVFENKEFVPMSVIDEAIRELDFGSDTDRTEDE